MLIMDMLVAASLQKHVNCHHTAVSIAGCQQQCHSPEHVASTLVLQPVPATPHLPFIKPGALSSLESWSDKG